MRRKKRKRKRKRIEICDLTKREERGRMAPPRPPRGAAEVGDKKVRTQEKKTAQQEV